MAVQGVPQKPDISQLHSICRVEIPKALFPYLNQVNARYYPVNCEVGGGANYAHVISGKATIGLASRETMDHPVIVVHEMMHLWLATKGWNESETSSIAFKAPVQPDGGQSSVDLAGRMLEDYIEHRIFTPIMHSAGLTEEVERRASLKRYETPLAPGYARMPANDAHNYLMMKLASPATAKEYADFLKSHGEQSALDAAALYDKIIESENPQDQKSASKAVQDCLNKVFAPHSVYLKAVPPPSTYTGR